MWALVLLAAVLRLPTLGLQSLWVDEAATARVVDVAGLGDLLRMVRDQESTPPLTYLVDWPLVRLLGDGEWPLRLPAALAGVATVAVVFAIGERLGGRRAAIACGLLAATNPLQVWFSQEARSYALLVLLVAGAVLLALRALERPTAGRLAGFGVVAGLALTTHYFALFVVAGLVGWLAWSLRARVGPREAVAGLAPLVLLGAAVLPLALDQRAADRAAFIRDLPLDERLLAVPKQWLVGYDGPLETPLAVVASALALAGLAGLARRFGPRAPGVLALAAVLAVSLLVPLASALVADDFVLTRNLLASQAVALPLLGLGLARLPAVAGRIALAALAAIGLACVVGVTTTSSWQREDWRAATSALPAVPGRVVAVVPGSGRLAAQHYLDLPQAGTGVVESSTIDVVWLARDVNGDQREEQPPAALVPTAEVGLVRVVRGEGWTVTRFATGDRRLVPTDLKAVLAPLPPGSVVLGPSR